MHGCLLSPAGLGAPDLFHANMIAREMILEMGMGRRTGPVDLMHVVPQKVRQLHRCL